MFEWSGIQPLIPGNNFASAVPYPALHSQDSQTTCVHVVQAQQHPGGGGGDSQLLHSRSSGLCSKILYQLLIHHQCLHVGVLHLPSCYQPAHLDQLLVQKHPCQVLPDWKQKKKKQVEEQTTDGYAEDFRHWISAGVLHDHKKKERLNQSLDLSSFVCMHWSWSQNCDNRLWELTWCYCCVTAYPQCQVVSIGFMSGGCMSCSVIVVPICISAMSQPR